MAAVISYDSLRRIPLLHNLNESEVHQIADVLRLRTFAPGEYVIRQGDQSRDLWIVMEGECEVVRRLKPDEKDHHQESLTLARLAQLAHFGEMSFFHPAPHSADVRAVRPLRRWGSVAVAACSAACIAAAGRPAVRGARRALHAAATMAAIPTPSATPRTNSMVSHAKDTGAFDGS